MSDGGDERFPYLDRSGAARPVLLGVIQDRRLVEDLTPYDRATVGLWARSYRAIDRQGDDYPFIEAAVHAVLTGLRRVAAPRSLFPVYETDATADLALIRSLLPADAGDELLWTARDAAFHLRWVELTGTG